MAIFKYKPQPLLSTTTNIYYAIFIRYTHRHLLALRARAADQIQELVDHLLVMPEEDEECGDEMTDAPFQDVVDAFEARPAEHIPTKDLIDELAHRTQRDPIWLSGSQDAAIVHGRKGSQTRCVAQVAGPCCILVVRQ